MKSKDHIVTSISNYFMILHFIVLPAPFISFIYWHQTNSNNSGTLVIRQWPMVGMKLCA